MADALFCSADRVPLSVEAFVWLILGGGWTDLAFKALDPDILRGASPTRPPPSTEAREGSSRRRSCRSKTPGPTDFLGGGFPKWVFEFETGGYWLCRRGRRVAESLGASLAVEVRDAVEEILVCLLLDTLGLRTMDPVLDRTGGG